jgi:hypothetical protein
MGQQLMGDMLSPNSGPAEYPSFRDAQNPSPTSGSSFQAQRDDRRAVSDRGFYTGGQLGPLPSYRTLSQLVEEAMMAGRNENHSMLMQPQYDLAGHIFREGDASQNGNGEYGGLVSETLAKPLPELVGPVGSLLPREKPSPQPLQFRYDPLKPPNPHSPDVNRAPYPYLSGEAQLTGSLNQPERNSMSPDVMQRWASQGPPPVARFPERKAAYNPMQWQMAQQETAQAAPNEDAVSDAALELLLNENGLLGMSEGEGAEERQEGFGGAHSHWPNGVAAGNGEGLGQRFEVTPLANGRGTANGGMHAAVRTAAELVSARSHGPEEDQFEADLKAAMNLSLEGEQELVSDHISAFTSFTLS